MNTNITKERVCLPGCTAEIGVWGAEIKKSVCECGSELVSVTNRIILIVCLSAYTLKQIHFLRMLRIVVALF